MKLVFLLKINNRNNRGVMFTLEKEDGHAQQGGAQAVGEAGDVVRIFTQDSLLISNQLFQIIYWNSMGKDTWGSK